MSNSNYIEKIFNKPREDVSLNDVKIYFESPQEETSVVEFKSGEVEIIDLYKEIAAFLNTEGGLLIVGTPRETKEKVGKNFRIICQGKLTYSNFKNKDWLYQKIASNIVPTPTDIKINEYISPDGTVFLLDIPQSSNPPHQSAADGKYYIRLEREAKAAPHGIVQALFDKRKKPKLTAEFEVKEMDSQTSRVSIRIRNLSEIPADKVSYITDVYNVSNIESDFDFKFFNDVLGDKFSMSVSGKDVLVQIISLPYHIDVKHFNKEFIVFVGHWCKETDFDFNFVTIDPLTNTIVREGTLKEGVILGDELERIRK